MKISGFDNIISIESFEYLNRIDNHELCYFSAWMKEDDLDKALANSDCDIDFEDDSFRFAGHVMDVSVSRDISGIFVEVRTIGKTYKSDQNCFSRVFQQEDKTISDILSHMKSMSDIEFQDKDNPTIGDVIFQNNETEWAFILRLINRYGFHLFSSEVPFIGRYGKEKIEIDNEQLIDYRFTKNSQSSNLFCRTDISLSIGSQIKYMNNEFYICAKKYVLDKGKYYFEYELIQITNDSEIKKDFVNEYLYAKVTDNNDPDKKGRLQVNFESENIEDCMKDSPMWIDRLDFYASKGFGPVFIPQIDDIVRIHLFNGDCKIVGCVRSEAYSSPYDDSNFKYLLLDDDIYILFGDGKITVHYKEEVIALSEDEITITSGDKSAIHSTKDKVLIQKDKAAIEITSDINASGGKFIVEAKGDTSISATNVNIKGKSGVSIN